MKFIIMLILLFSVNAYAIPRTDAQLKTLRTAKWVKRYKLDITIKKIDEILEVRKRYPLIDETALTAERTNLQTAIDAETP